MDFSPPGDINEVSLQRIFDDHRYDQKSYEKRGCRSGNLDSHVFEIGGKNRKNTVVGKNINFDFEIKTFCNFELLRLHPFLWTTPEETLLCEKNTARNQERDFVVTLN